MCRVLLAGQGYCCHTAEMKILKFKVVWVALVLCALWWWWPTLARRIMAQQTTPAAGQPWQDSGQFGDTYGGLNALFTGLACLGVFITFLEQRKQNERISSELKKEETARNNGTIMMQSQVRMMESQARAMATTAFVTALVHRIDGYHIHIKQLRDRGVMGTAPKIQELTQQRDNLIGELEGILRESREHLKDLPSFTPIEEDESVRDVTTPPPG